MNVIHQFIRHHPLLRKPGYWAFRGLRNAFWRFRRTPYNPLSPPASFVPFVSRHLDPEAPFSLLEVGCNSGATLRALSRLHPAGSFTGVDLQKSAVELGQSQPAGPDEGRVDLRFGNMLHLEKELEMDYIISNATLIYLDEREMAAFLGRVGRAVRRKLIFREIASRTPKVVKAHFFAHPYRELFRRLDLDAAFDIVIEPLGYEPWCSDAYCGVDMVLSRRKGG